MDCGDLKSNVLLRKVRKQTVFESKVCRIPALLYAGKTLLAFAEQRRTPDDAHGEMLVMKTGKVNEESSGKTIEWSELKPVEKAQIKGYRPMNPCPVYDKASKKLFLFFICVEDAVSEDWQIQNYNNKARLCYITSADLGESWSDVTDLTEELTEIKDWATFAVGPGHGIQTEGGRLIVPLYAYFCPMRKKPIPKALSLYSDDHGEKWEFGQMFETTSVECEMAEVYDDNGSSFIYCNARNVKGYRVEAVSNDERLQFNILESKLKETDSGCQGSVVSFPAQNESANIQGNHSQSPNKWLLFSHPASSERRINLGVYLNKAPHDPKAWGEPWIINDGPSGYSDLAYIDDGWFACLLECGEQSETEQIGYLIFSYNEVERGSGV